MLTGLNIMSLQISCATHKNFKAVCISQVVLWAALIFLHDRESAGLPNQNQVINKRVKTSAHGHHEVLYI